MSARAGIVITGTEVLSGIIPDANGPWLAGQLRERGVQLAHVVIVGDRPDDVRAALEFLAREEVDLAITSGGLGPTADDLTADVVAAFAGREMVLDEALEERIWGIVSTMRGRRWPQADEAAMRAGARKQAYVPRGATVLEPVGTAPGLVVPPADGSAGPRPTPGSPTVLVLPGPPRELQPMWADAVETDAVRRALAGAGTYEQRIMRLYGIPEAELAATLRELPGEGASLDGLEITTCLRRGELEIATVFEPSAEPAYAGLEAGILRHHGEHVFATDGETIDDIVAGLLLGRDGAPTFTVATAESCTGGLMAGRLTDRAGSSAYVLGGVVAYANEAKVAMAGVPAELIARHGAVSPEVADALAAGARARFGTDVGIGITGIAGPGGGTPEKPVGTVCLTVDGVGDRELREARTLHLAGGRADVRDRSTVVAMHMLRRVLLAAR